MTTDPKILSDKESAARRWEQANSSPGRSVTMCAQAGCPRAAWHGPWCADHRQGAGPRLVAVDLTDAEIAEIRAEIDQKAAPLFLIAMDWLTRQQLGRAGVELPAGDAA